MKSYLKKKILKYGYYLTKKSNYYNLINQLNCLLAFNEAQIKRSKNISFYIFSKDRPMQLYALLESMERFIKSKNFEIFVLYNFSDREFETGYNYLKLKIKNLNIFKKIYLEHELKSTFKTNILNTLKKIKNDKIFFLCDDNIFVDNFNYDEIKKIDLNKCIFSLRHGLNLSFSYHKKKLICIPNLTKIHNSRLYEFNWSEGDEEWSDPWSLDGHLYDTHQIYKIAHTAIFNGPNSFEAVLKQFDLYAFKKKGICFANPLITNLAFNRVQSEAINPSGFESPKKMLKLWLNNKKLDLDFYIKKNFNSTVNDYELVVKQQN